MCRRPVTLGGGRSWMKAFAGLSLACGRGDVEEALADPVVGPALLDDGGVVGFGELAEGSARGFRSA